jgi:hypothetical protein
MTSPDLYEISKNLKGRGYEIFGPNFEKQRAKVRPCLIYLKQLTDNDQEAFCAIINKIATDDKLTVLLQWLGDTLIKELAYDEEAAFSKVVSNEEAANIEEAAHIEEAAYQKKMQCYRALIPFASPEALCQASGYDPNIWPVILETTRHYPNQSVQSLQPTSEGPIDTDRAPYLGPCSSAQDEMNNYCWVMRQPLWIRTSMAYRNMKNWEFKSRPNEIADVWRVELQKSASEVDN